MNKYNEISLPSSQEIDKSSSVQEWVMAHWQIVRR